MEQTFSEIKKKDVINLIDGKHLGKVCDISFTFPENNVHGFTVTGGKGIRWNRQDVFLPIKCVVKIGQDAVLVKLGRDDEKQLPQNEYQTNPCKPNYCPPPPPHHGHDRRDLGEYE